MSTSNTQQRYIMLDSLTILRGPAALIVFMYHVVHNTSWGNWLPAASVGYVGVALFFVLSGFVLTWSFKPEEGAKAFYIRRFARVYPLHFTFFIVALVMAVIASTVPEFPKILANMFLVQAWVPDWTFIFSLNAVSWSLACEAFFYACTPWLLYFFSRRHEHVSYIVLASWFVLSASTASIVSLSSNYADVVVYANPLLRSGEFALGMLLGLVALKIRNYNLRIPAPPRWAPWAAVTLALIAFYASSKISTTQTIRGFILDPVWFVLIATLAWIDFYASRTREQQKRSTLKKALIYLGEVSFAFYLVHETVIQLVHKTGFGMNSHGGVRGILCMVLCLGVALVLAMAAHHFIERPARTMIIARVQKRK